MLTKVAIKLDLDKLAMYEYNPSPVGILLNPNKKGKTIKTTNKVYKNINKYEFVIMLIASQKASTNKNKLLSKFDMFKKIVFVAKFVNISAKLTDSRLSPQYLKVGIRSETHMPMIIILYKSNFQKTEKLATNNLSEFLNIINKSPY